MLISAEEYGKRQNPPISKQRVYQLIERGDIVKTGKKIDTEHPTNVAWVEGRKGQDHQPKPPGRWVSPTPTPPAVPTSPSPQPDNKATLENVDPEEVLAHMATIDIRRFSKSDIDKLKSLETAMKIRQDRQQKRGELIDRNLVRSVFGKLYQIDSNELRVVGARLAPSITGLLGSDDPEKILQVEKLIDDQIAKSLSHIQRLLNDALVAWKAEGGVG